MRWRGILWTRASMWHRAGLAASGRRLQGLHDVAEKTQTRKRIRNQTGCRLFTNRIAIRKNRSNVQHRTRKRLRQRILAIILTSRYNSTCLLLRCRDRTWRRTATVNTAQWVIIIVSFQKDSIKRPTRKKRSSTKRCQLETIKNCFLKLILLRFLFWRTICKR